MASDYTNPFAGQSNPYQGNANPFLSGSNPYLTANIDKAQGDVVRNYNMTTQPAFNSAMVKSGSFGNEGVQQMNENSQKNLQSSLGDISNSMRGADYQNRQNLYMQQQAQDSNNYLANRAQDIGNYQWDQGFNRSLFNDAYSQNMNNLQTGVGLLGTLAGYNANDLTNANTIQNTPLNYWSNFSNQANGMGQGYGTTTGTVGTTSSPWTSALGGAQLGSAAMGWWNNQGRSGGSSGSPTDANGYALSNYGSGGSASGVTPYL
jgi:hypothetical protein